MKKIFVSIIFIITSYSHADFSLNQQDIALKVCLNGNYENFGVYKSKDLKDYSNANSIYGAEQTIRLLEFVEKETNSFYLENPSMQEAGAGTNIKINAIFLRCMQFYKSKKLKHFIQHNK